MMVVKLMVMVVVKLMVTVEVNADVVVVVAGAREGRKQKWWR
jgi:hypothetical protein